jgi:hypothetical protein
MLIFSRPSFSYFGKETLTLFLRTTELRKACVTCAHVKPLKLRYAVLRHITKRHFPLEPFHLLLKLFLYLQVRQCLDSG